jgi:hypothetical protein
MQKNPRSNFSMLLLLTAIPVSSRYLLDTHNLLRNPLGNVKQSASHSFDYLQKRFIISSCL